MLSDGKLETSDGRNKEALEQIRQTIDRQLPDIDFYSVVLGETTSRQPIPLLQVQNLDGQGLMSGDIARSADRCYVARSLDQLLHIAPVVMTQVKGMTPFEVAADSGFRVDRTIESFSLIVQKRDVSGSELYKSDLRLEGPGLPPDGMLRPGMRQYAGKTSIYWNNSYSYFDLITVRSPQEGLWRVHSPGAGRLKCFRRMATPVELQVVSKEAYFLDQASEITAKLFDKRYDWSLTMRIY